MMRGKLIIFACLMLVASACVAGAAEGKDNGLWLSVYAKRVVDGDTFVFKKGVDDRCRMLGYTAPEKKEDKELYRQASHKLGAMITGAKLLIYTQKRDRWNRLLCEVYLPDGTHVNKVMRAWLEEMGYKGVGKYDRLGGVR